MKWKWQRRFQTILRRKTGIERNYIVNRRNVTQYSGKSGSTYKKVKQSEETKNPANQKDTSNLPW